MVHRSIHRIPAPRTLFVQKKSWITSPFPSECPKNYVCWFVWKEKIPFFICFFSILSIVHCQLVSKTLFSFQLFLSTRLLIVISRNITWFELFFRYYSTIFSWNRMRVLTLDDLDILNGETNRESHSFTCNSTIPLLDVVDETEPNPDNRQRNAN